MVVLFDSGVGCVGGGFGRADTVNGCAYRGNGGGASIFDVFSTFSGSALHRTGRARSVKTRRASFRRCSDARFYGLRTTVMSTPLPRMVGAEP